MKTKRKKTNVLRQESTEDQIIRWVTRHDPMDRLESGQSEIIQDHSDLDELVRDAMFQANTAQLNMRIPPALKAALSKLARERTTDATTLGRIWLAERIRKELGGE